jgi:DNA-binding beta-propeller fold protein YncE
MQRGFTLVQVSILLLAASLVLLAVLPGTRTALDANSASVAKMNTILTALRQYESVNASLPCPADASKPTGGTGYGVAAANPGTGSPGNCTGGSPAANYVDAANNVAIGMVPVRALGLHNDYALDAYGRDITYAVDTNATVCFTGILAGKITVTEGGTTSSSIAALVSHGSDGHGAWIPLTGTTGTAVRLNAGSTDTDQLINAHVTSAFAATSSSLLTSAESTTTTFVSKLPTSTFDDLVVYKSPLWTLNAAPASTAGMVPTITPPSNGRYYTGQTLTFTVTYGNTVTVTGTPELTLSIPQQGGSTATRYATFTGSSGNSLTFSYTVQSTDYAPSSPSSVAMTSPIVLNGGTISVNGAAACLTFTAPSLTGVLLNPVTIYISDGNGNRVEKFDTSGNYLGQIGKCASGACTSGNGNGQFHDPGPLAFDSGGNLWIGDYGNYRAEKFDSAGNYLSQFASGALNLEGIAFDKDGNIWIVDHYSNNILKYDSSGSLLATYGSSGSTNGKFNSPIYIAVDASNNIWVEDYNNNRVQKFDHNGTFLLGLGSGYQGASGSIGSAGSGPGQLNSPNGIVFDAGGNLWVADAGNERLEEFNGSGAYVSQIDLADVLSGVGGWITGLAIDPSGNFWVEDYNNDWALEFSSCGTYLSKFGSTGTGNGQFNHQIAYIAITGTPGGGGACVASVTPPSNGSYATGQALNFTVTYNQAVTVTGTPRLLLTIGSNTRYANYVSGSGTTTLTFSYTIQAGDSATGIASSSSIDLNGGTITTASNGINANTGYTAPSMGGILVNSTAFMLVADGANARIQKFDLAGSYISQFGTYGSSNGQLEYAASVAIDGSGKILVTDGYNERVEKFDSNGNYVSKFGSSGNADGQFSFTNNSSGITVDGSGNIWVADHGNNRVQKFDSSGNFLMGIGAGYNGVSGSKGSSGTGNGQFNTTQYVHLDFNNNVWVSECAGHRVQQFDGSGNWLKTIGPTVAGYSSTLDCQDDFAFDSCRNLWLTDENNGNFLVLDYAGNYVNKIAESTGASGMQGLAIDGSGRIYMTSEGSNLVNIYDSSATFLFTFGSSGSGNGQFNQPQAIAIAGSAVTYLPLSSCPAVILSAAGPPNGTYVTGNTLGFAVTYDQAVTVTGTPQLSITVGGPRLANYVSGSGTTTLTFQYTVTSSDNANAGTGVIMNVPISLNGGTITSNSISSNLYFQPPTLTGVLVNPVTPSDFYIADTSNHRVRKVTASTGFISTVAGTGSSGAFTAGAATSSKLNAPSGLALDSSGNLYIADSGDHAVAKVSSGTLSYFAGTGSSGTVTAGAATSSKLNSPTGIAFDGSGNAYIADGGNHEVLKVASGTLSVFAGTGTSGTVTAGAATSSKLNSPTRVAVDSSGNVYIADGGNHQVLKVTSGGTLSVFAGTGSSGSTHENDGSLATAAKLKTPYGVAVDSSGNVYIADSGNSVILKVAASTGVISIVAGTGSAGYSGDGGAAASAQLNGPKGLAVDSSGNIYIADTSNNRVRWVLPSFGDISPIAGNGTGGYTGDGAAATSAEINAPAGVVVSR